MPRRLGKEPEIYNIPAHQSFVDVLAKGVIDRFGSDPISLSKVLILLPNRRAVRSLGEAFLRLMNGNAAILPNMQPIGDVDEDGLVIGGGGFYEDLELKPAIPGLNRQIILMKIIQDWYTVKKKDVPDLATCALLAEALGNLLDQVQTEEIEFQKLKNIVPAEYALHWQETIEFLKIITKEWPETLASIGFMDGAVRRNKLMYGLRQQWLEKPPEHPIIAAGSTGSIKVTSELLKVIARLPKGMVILPGLDQNIDNESWDAIEDTHPQATMKQLLETIGADRSEVENWDGSPITQIHERTLLFREVMRPAETTHLWQNLDLNDLKGVRQIITPGIPEEAGIIALMMREQLENPEKTAALVTPDRMLARQVACELGRWGIEIDDSAGTPLFNKAVGIYLRLTAEMVSEQYTPLTLMSALKHPLMAGGIDVADFRANVRRFERNYMRGPRPQPGLEGLDKIFHHESEADDRLYRWWQKIQNIITPFDELMRAANPTFEEILIAHIEMAEKLAATADIPGDKRLWQGEDGEVASTLIQDMMDAAPYMRNFTADQYSALFEQFMKSVTVRSKYGQHPRLNIWGPLEARLQHADLMILSGLNEGIWPPEAGNDPWMSRPMRKDFGLPGLEQKIGLSAHDFVQTASAKNVVITRSEKQDGTPTVKSRWLNRLHAIVGEQDHTGESEKWLSLYKKLDQPEKDTSPSKAPKPTPPVEARPRSLSVTRIQEWMRDPYALYAKKILNLEKLDELDQDPDAMDKGIIIHDILEEFMTAYKVELPENADEILIEIGRKYFEGKIDKPTVRAFWWPRFKQIAKWFIETERDRRPTVRTEATESQGAIELDLPGGPFTLSARADRIDKFPDGSLCIIDYKTGTAPTLSSIKAGYSPQLPLEGVIAEHGGFELLPASKVSELSYWKLSGGKEPGKITYFNAEKDIDISTEITKSYQGLIKLITTFDIQETPYLSNPNPLEKGYGEYDHLARSKEWGESDA